MSYKGISTHFAEMYRLEVSSAQIFSLDLKKQSIYYCGSLSGSLVGKVDDF